MAILRLFRRHQKNCQKAVRYSRVPAVRRHALSVLAIASVASHWRHLRRHGYVTTKATRETDWAKAEAIAAQWEEWGDFAVPPGLQPVDVSI